MKYSYKRIGTHDFEKDPVFIGKSNHDNVRISLKFLGIFFIF